MNLINEQKKMVTNAMRYIHLSNGQSTGTFAVILQSCLKPVLRIMEPSFPQLQFRDHHLWDCPIPAGLTENYRRTIPHASPPSTPLFSLSDKVGRKEGAFLEIAVFIKSKFLLCLSPLMENRRPCFPTLRPRG